MRLQFLGDYPDAFKWDALHWMCTRSFARFDSLLIVPMLTPDEPESTHGGSSPDGFPCRPFIKTFLRRLRDERSLRPLSELGTLNEPRFEVIVHPDPLPIGNAFRRYHYWGPVCTQMRADQIVFMDPDNGFETKSQRARKHFRHDEAARVMSAMPESSALVVYQHWRRQRWHEAFSEIADDADYAETVSAVYLKDLALVAMSKNSVTGQRINAVLEDYKRHNPLVGLWSANLL
jgi:hypothetical protein